MTVDPGVARSQGAARSRRLRSLDGAAGVSHSRLMSMVKGRIVKYVAVIQYQHHDRLAEVSPSHRQYLAELKAQEKLLAAGRFTDQRWALIIYEARSEDELREMIAADPFDQAGIFAEMTINEWNQVY